MKLAFSQVADREEKSFIVDIPENPRIEPEILIGRARNCDIQIQNLSVSRRHCGIRVDTTSHALHVRDYGSENGTYVNDKPVGGPCDIVDGDTLTVGSLALTVKIVDASVWDRIAARFHAAKIDKPRIMQFMDG